MGHVCGLSERQSLQLRWRLIEKLIPIISNISNSNEVSGCTLKVHVDLLLVVYCNHTVISLLLWSLCSYFYRDIIVQSIFFLIFSAHYSKSVLQVKDWKERNPTEKYSKVISRDELFSVECNVSVRITHSCEEPTKIFVSRGFTMIMVSQCVWLREKICIMHCFFIVFSQLKCKSFICFFYLFFFFKWNISTMEDGSAVIRNHCWDVYFPKGLLIFKLHQINTVYYNCMFSCEINNKF